MSFTNLRNHGVYETEKPALLNAKAYFDGFQYCELTSGSVATPRSPIEPPRASGAILRVVTPVVMGLNMSFPSPSA